MAPGDTARLYHRLTSYGREREWDAPVDDPRVLRDFEANVRATFPAHCKAYPAGLPVVELPRKWPLGWWLGDNGARRSPHGAAGRG